MHRGSDGAGAAHYRGECTMQDYHLGPQVWAGDSPWPGAVRCGVARFGGVCIAPARNALLGLLRSAEGHGSTPQRQGALKTAGNGPFRYWQDDSFACK